MLLNLDLSGIAAGEPRNASPIANALAAIQTAMNGELETENLKANAIDPWSVLTGFDDWQDWTPSYSASGSMTYTSVATDVAKFIKLGTIVFFLLRCNGTTGGTGGTNLRFTLPVSAADSGAAHLGGACDLTDSTQRPGVWNNMDANTARVYKQDGSNFGLGSGRVIVIQGFYRVA